MDRQGLASSSDDEGAPEEVGLQAGKAAVFEQQAKQSESRQQLRLSRKQQRQDQAALDQQRAGERASKRRKPADIEPEHSVPSQEGDRLPDTVIAALLARQRCATSPVTSPTCGVHLHISLPNIHLWWVGA